MFTWLRCVVSEEHAPVAGYSQTALWVWITPFSFGCRRNQRKIALLLGWNKALSPAPACSQSDTKLLSGMKSHACGISHTTTRTYAAVRNRLWLQAELCACGSPSETNLTQTRQGCTTAFWETRADDRHFALVLHVLSQRQKGRKHLMTNTSTSFEPRGTGGATL